MKLISFTSLLLMAAPALLAQESSKKLKDIQNESFLAPSPVKIDGKVREWDGFQAYNKSTHLYYTLSNDDQNLYLVIKTSDLTTNAKIGAGGLTFAVNTAGKKKEQDAFSLTFPVPQRPQFRQGGGGAMAGGGARTVNFTVGDRGGSGGGAQGQDSAMRKAMQERVINNAKEIKVSGFKDIQDSLIAIYNDYKIKAAIDYDKDNAFIYELAVPLKLLGLEAGDKKELAYNIKLNGLQLNFRMPDGGDGPRGGGGGNFGSAGDGGTRVMSFGGPGGGGPGRGGIDFQEMISPSDFWGKYTLAKKQ